MNAENRFTNFYVPLSNDSLVFKDEIPSVPEPEEEKQTISEEIFDINLRYQFYDLNKQTKECIELMSEIGLAEYSPEDWLADFKEVDDAQNFEYIDQIPVDGNIEVKRSCLFHTQYLRSSIEEVSEKFDVPLNLIKKWINEFTKNLRLRNSANRKYLNKSKLIEDNHKTYLFKHWNSPFSKPCTLNELCEKLTNEFPELNRVSKSTISRTLKDDLSIGFRKLWNVSPKLKDVQEVSKLAKSALLLKRLEDQKLELIFIDELKFSERQYKAYGWRQRGK